MRKHQDSIRTPTKPLPTHRPDLGEIGPTTRLTVNIHTPDSGTVHGRYFQDPATPTQSFHLSSTVRRYVFVMEQRSGSSWETLERNATLDTIPPLDADTISSYLSSPDADLALDESPSPSKPHIDTDAANTTADGTSTNLSARSVLEKVQQTFRFVLSTIYLCYIVLTIPLSFEMGGLNCGLSYSLTILLLYFSLATLRLLKYHRFISTFLYYLQHMFLPSILSLFLAVFASEESIPDPQTPAARVWWSLVEVWKVFLVNSTPLFTILEGFCSLLSIQAIGQLSQYLNRRSDTWSIVSLITSSCILLACVYFAAKIYISPELDLSNVGMVSASLLGSMFTCLLLITVFGVASGRASPLECSLLVAYIVKCSYEIFPELSKSNFNSIFKFAMTEFKKIDSQASLLNRESYVSAKAALQKHTLPSDQILLLVYVKIRDFLGVMFHFIVENFPRSFEPLWDFMRISVSNLTFPILAQLAYRILVFFAATKIIPILQPFQRDSPLSTPTRNKPAKRVIDQQSRGSRLLYLYSPCIIIAVYTNLMIQYSDELDKQSGLWQWGSEAHSYQFWNWVNIFTVLVLYLSELINHDPDDRSLADHWAAGAA